MRHAAAVFVALVALVPVAASGGDEKPTFLGVATSRFDAWDADHDGKISLAEADRLVDDPGVKGAEAAALAVLKRIQRSDKYGRPEPDRAMLERFTTGALLDGPDESGDEPADGVSRGEPLPNIDRMFSAALARIRKADRTLFEAGAPDLRAIRQGPLGDCFFLAPVGAAVARDPAAVKAMFATRPDGGCDLTFPGGKKISVAPPTDAELALTSWTGGDGVWLNVLEKAYATIRNESQAPAKRKASVTDAIASGGSSAPVLQLLTGAATHGLALREKGQAEVRPTEEQAAAKLPKLREEIAAAVAAKRLACCSTSKSKEVPGISPNHAYAILGFDEKTDVVEVWNPHGNAFRPKGEPSLERGYPTKDGRFRLPLADFARIFARAVFESAPKKPAEK